MVYVPFILMGVSWFFYSLCLCIPRLYSKENDVDKKRQLIKLLKIFKFTHVAMIGMSIGFMYLVLQTKGVI